MSKALLLAASIAIAVPLSAQQAPAPSEAPVETAQTPENTIEGATPDRVAQVESCQGHKFESRIEIDPVKRRSTRIKLCADPGGSDADWVKTLEAAIVQIEQRNMPPVARQQLIGELESEIARFATTKPAPMASGATLYVTDPGAAARLAGPTERYETSVLPPLPAPKAARAANAAASLPSQRPIRVALKCLERGQSGAGGTCDYLESSTTLVVRAVEGLDAGGTLRFRRRGDLRGEVALAPMPAGQLARVKLPGDVCRGVSNTSVEIELLGPKSA
ncbi:MAG TPA: hypothetical protein VGR05_08705, partial [Sphingomicrobium sp.]|nr:hypothetical protein [Sphingomicrobium sp.]